METYEIIKNFRLDNKLTQVEFGKILNCDRSRIADIERGKTAPNIDDIKAISKKFNVSSDYLLGLSDGKKIDDDAKAVCNYTGLNEEAIEVIKELCSDETLKIKKGENDKNNLQFFNLGAEKKGLSLSDSEYNALIEEYMNIIDSTKMSDFISYFVIELLSNYLIANIYRIYSLEIMKELTLRVLNEKFPSFGSNKQPSDKESLAGMMIPICFGDRDYFRWMVEKDTEKALNDFYSRVVYEALK